MAKKKKKRPNQFRPSRNRPSSKPSDPPPLPDWRSMEAGLHDLVGDRASPGTPQRQAEDLVAQAFQTHDPLARVLFARRAISLWPDCADAFVLLAEHASGHKETLRLYRQAVEAGERALGPDGLREAAGHFWGYLHTRPYMRARLGLALALWTAGEKQEAVRHAQELLKLNPADNQGIRYTLTGLLLGLDRDDELTQFLEQYPDEISVYWAYSRALLAFRREGDSPEARRLLESAKKVNRHVPDYLLGRKYPPAEQPSYYGHGDENGALVYVSSALPAWKDTAGAIAWMRANDEQVLAAKANVTSPTGPLGFVKTWLSRKLPQQDDVWQAEFRATNNWIKVGGFPARLWIVLVTSHSTGLILAHEAVQEEPQSARLWDALLHAMQNPLKGDPHRPSHIQVRLDPRWEALRPHLDEVGIALTVAERLEPLDDVFVDLFEALGGEAEPGLLDEPGVSPELVAAFYESAARYFEQKPWRTVGSESAVEIACERFQGGPWYGVVMGQSGLTMGLALYADLKMLKQLWAGGSDRRAVATSVTFGEEWTVPMADLDAARKYGWRVARPDAHPAAIRKEGANSIRLPLAWELQLLEGSLQVVPELARRRRQDDPTREEILVRIGTEEVKFVVSWVPEDGR